MNSIQLDMDSLRAYLVRSDAQCGHDVVADWALRGDEGAQQLVMLAQGVRVNRRTRRSLWQVAAQCRVRESVRKHWYALLCEGLYGLYRQMLVLALPNTAPRHQLMPGQHFSRRVRQTLRATGTVRVAQDDLAQQGRAAVQQTWSSIRNSDSVVWIDNWYVRRYGFRPDGSDLSLNVTAIAVLRLTQPRATRRTTLAAYPGHMGVAEVIQGLIERLDWVGRSMESLADQIDAILAGPIGYREVRVPLDEARPRVQRDCQWVPLTLSQSRVGDAKELLEVLAGVRELQQRSGRAMPLLVDEKIHYSIMKMLYAQGWQGWRMGQWLRQVPVLYGVWHPYKQVVNLVYRAFLPILSRLERDQPPRAGEQLHCGKKLRYLETLFGTLLVASWSVRDELESAWQMAAGELQTESSGESVTRNSEYCTDEVLGGLRALVQVWLPVVFSLGCRVRDCYWLGGPTGSLRGTVAKEVLGQCLAVVASLRQDWEAKEEYTRSLAVALQVWEPWMDRVPAKCFVEEACESLLARAKQSLQQHRHLTGFESAVDLFVTLERVSGEVHSLHGGVRAGTVATYRSRLRQMVRSQFRVQDAFAHWKPGGKTSWVRGLRVHCFPDSVEWDNRRLGRQLMESALQTLMNRAGPDARAAEWLEGHVAQQQAQRLVYGPVRVLTRERLERERVLSQSQGRKRRRGEDAESVVAEGGQSDVQSVQSAGLASSPSAACSE